MFNEPKEPIYTGEKHESTVWLSQKNFKDGKLIPHSTDQSLNIYTWALRDSPHIKCRLIIDIPVPSKEEILIEIQEAYEWHSGPDEDRLKRAMKNIWLLRKANRL